MIIKLKKEWSPGARLKPIGTEFDVTTELGNELISKGIAERLDVSYPIGEVKMFERLIEDEELQDDVQKVKVKTTKQKPKK